MSGGYRNNNPPEEYFKAQNTRPPIEALLASVSLPEDTYEVRIVKLRKSTHLLRISQIFFRQNGSKYINNQNPFLIRIRTFKSEKKSSRQFSSHLSRLNRKCCIYRTSKAKVYQICRKMIYQKPPQSQL